MNHIYMGISQYGAINLIVREGLQRSGYGATDGPIGLQTPRPDLPRHDLDPRDIVCPGC
jgi:hypothetical protein